VSDLLDDSAFCVFFVLPFAFDLCFSPFCLLLSSIDCVAHIDTKFFSVLV